MSGGGGDSASLQHRDKNEDSITIYFRYLDSSKLQKPDTSINSLNDFTTVFPIPADHLFLGNLGNASESFLFNPVAAPGFNPGFHAYDVYKWKKEKVKFYKTTRPYSELNYLLGSKTEQMIEVFHTQNIKPNWNAQFRYRLINSPGFFKNQNSYHNNYLFTSWYQGTAKRYNNFVMLLANNLHTTESGGIRNDTNYLDNLAIYKNRFDIPTQIGGDAEYTTNFFSKNIYTGNKYDEFTALMRQQYDLGKKDSLVTDSTVIPLFYPRLRFEHTFTYNSYKYQYNDIPHSLRSGFYIPDSAYYHDNYNITINPGDTISIKDRWKIISNDFSIYQFPDAKNLQQFIKIGATLELIKGEFATSSKSYYNTILHGEYRNKTKNQKWDAELYGNLYSTGFNAGDYNAHISLKRFVGKKKTGYAEIGFENVNRSPSYLYESRSSFHLDNNSNFKKENTTHFFASLYQPALKLRLSGDYFLVSNYLYFYDYYKLGQYEPLFNLIRISAQKVFKLNKRWSWYADVYVQQKAGAVPLNVPLVFTRNRIAYEGKFFRNLNLSTGVEIRYNTQYKADAYSPLLGQFMYQDSTTISNRPTISAFAHFRIRKFKGFVRAENLNTAQFNSVTGFGFTKNNLGAPGYAYPGLQIRFGIWWNFIN